MKKISFCLLVLFIFGSYASAEEPKIYIVFRNDDISALSNTAHEKRIMNIFEKFNIPQTFGVIPDVAENGQDPDSNRYHPISENHDIIKLLKEGHEKGLIEIAQHGYTHKTNRPYSMHEKAAYSEFRGLSYKKQLEKILSGKKILEDSFGIQITSFIVPWNSHDYTTMKAIADSGFNLVGSDINFDEHKITCPTIIQSTPLNKFKTNFKKAEEFVRDHNTAVIINVLYHSQMLKEKDIQLLQEDLNEISSNKAEFMTLEQLERRFKNRLLELEYIKNCIENIGRQLDRVGIKSSLSANSGFLVLSKEYYIKERNFGYLIIGLFYFVALILGMILGAMTSFLALRLKIVKKYLIRVLYFLNILIVAYLFYSFFGFFGFEKGFGLTDYFFIIMLISCSSIMRFGMRVTPTHFFK